MSLLGKLLLVVNLLAAAGFVYLATQDWRGRQSIAASGLRHVLLVYGLPLEGPDTFAADDETPFVVSEGMPGGVPTQTVSKKVLDTYFQAAPGASADNPASLAGGPVLSQIAEVKRVKGKIEEHLRAAASTDAKLALLRQWLLWQAETFDERLAILALLNAGNVEELEKRLLARFDAVIAAPKAADPDAQSKLDAAETDPARISEKLSRAEESRAIPLDEAERRAKLAHLLVHLDTDAAWQKRVMIVVGLRRYVATVAAQAERFKYMAARVERQMVIDQGIDVEVTLPGGVRVKLLTGYLGEVAINAERARDATGLAAQQRTLRTYWEKQKAEQDNQVAQRQTQLKELENQLRRIKAEVDELLFQQAVVEAGLFEIQREVAITLDELYKLETELARRERELLGLPPKP